MTYILLAVLFNPPYTGEPCTVSWYGDSFHGQLTASGRVYDQEEMTCAHKTLPLGSLVEFTNVTSGESWVLWVTDRGPYVEGRDFDFSRGAFREIIGDLNVGVDQNSLNFRVVGRETKGLLYNLATQPLRTER